MLNQVVLTGNLGADPEIFYRSEGDPVATFNLAFKSTKKKKASYRAAGDILTKMLYLHSKYRDGPKTPSERWWSNPKYRRMAGGKGPCKK